MLSVWEAGLVMSWWSHKWCHHHHHYWAVLYRNNDPFNPEDNNSEHQPALVWSRRWYFVTIMIAMGLAIHICLVSLNPYSSFVGRVNKLTSRRHSFILSIQNTNISSYESCMKAKVTKASYHPCSRPMCRGCLSAGAGPRWPEVCDVRRRGALTGSGCDCTGCGAQTQMEIQGSVLRWCSAHSPNTWGHT